MLKVHFTADDLRPLIQSVVNETIATLQAEQDRLGDRLAFSEPEAAKVLGLERHVLRDIRLRGEIEYCRIANRRIAYERSALLKYLADHRG